MLLVLNVNLNLNNEDNMARNYDKPILDEDNNPIKIAEVGDHHCIRCTKKANAFKKIGYKVYGVGAKPAYGIDTYETYHMYKNQHQFKQTIKTLIDIGVKIITWNNEPHHQAVWTREVITEMGAKDKVKLVVDVHDSDLIRRTFAPLDEINMFRVADGIIYASLPIQNMLNRAYKVTVPYTTIYSYCNEGVVEYDETLERKNAMVYEGGANPPENKEYEAAFKYRSLYHIIKALVEQGNEVHAFLGNIDAYEPYCESGACIYPPTDYAEMMRALVKFKYGLCIFNNPQKDQAQVQFTLTNKMFEYVQAGLPVLACYCKETEEYVKKHNIGFVFDKLEDIGNASQLEEQYKEIYANLQIQRKELVMENFIQRLESLYAGVLGIKGKSIDRETKKRHIEEYGKEEALRTFAYNKN